MIRLPRRITEKVTFFSNGYECFRISYESLRISYDAYDQSAEFRVNPLRIVRLLTNVLSRLSMERVLDALLLAALLFAARVNNSSADRPFP